MKQLDLNSDKKHLGGRRVDWLINILLIFTEPRYRTKHDLKRAGYVRNRWAEDAAEASISSARDVEVSRGSIMDGTTGCAAVSSPEHAPGYIVTGALTAYPLCSCPCGISCALCKHLVKVMRMLGKSEPEILEIWGTLRGSSFGDRMIARWTAPAEEPGCGAEHAGGSEPAGSVVPQLVEGTQPQVAVTGARRTATGPTVEACEAALDAAMGTMKTRLHGKPVSEWQAAILTMLAANSNMCVSTARSSMFRGPHSLAVLLLVNPGGSEGMSWCARRAFWSLGVPLEAIRSSSSQPRDSIALLGPTNSASAKQPPPVPFQPVRNPTMKAGCFGDGYAQKAGPKFGQLSQSGPVPLQNVANQCRPVPLRISSNTLVAAQPNY